MNITSFFADVLNAPVVNKMWSWGAENKETGTYFLRAGYNNILAADRSNGHVRMKVQLSYNVNSHGEKERLRHITDILENGKAAYVVMLHGKDNENGIFKIDSFDAERVWPIEELVYDFKTKTFSAWLAMPVNVSSLIQE